MQRSATVKDIAQGAEVSIATVSRVLNNHANINEDIRQRVLQVAEELGYEKNEKPLRPRGKNLKEIGFLLAGDVDVDANIFWLPVLQGAEMEASKARLRLSYQGVATNIETSLLIHKILEMRTDGLLLVGPFPPDAVRAVQALTIPYVLIDNYMHIPGQTIDAVLSDNIAGIKDAVKYLVSKGHHNIVFVGGHTTASKEIYTFRQRKVGYIEALQEAGLPLIPELLLEIDVTSIEEINEACRRLINTQVPFTAMVCVNDPTASYMVKALREHNVRIPQDVSCIGFDDIAIAEHMTPSLTTIHVHTDLMGSLAVKRLIERNADPKAVGITYLVDVNLVERDSVIRYQP
jgi:LacI family transcriptional regulator